MGFDALVTFGAAFFESKLCLIRIEEYLVMGTRPTSLANQYSELQRLRRELYLMEEKLVGSKIEAEGTQADYDGQTVRRQRGDRPHENTRRSAIQR